MEHVKEDALYYTLRARITNLNHDLVFRYFKILGSGYVLETKAGTWKQKCKETQKRDDVSVELRTTIVAVYA
ncbi:hypothetical protein YC2023_059519 [Brassica napus]